MVLARAPSRAWMVPSTSAQHDANAAAKAQTTMPESQPSLRRSDRWQRSAGRGMQKVGHAGNAYWAQGVAQYSSDN